MKHSMEVPWKTKNKIPIWFSNPTPGHISRPNYNSKRSMHPNVHSSIFTTAKKQQQFECPPTGNVYSGILSGPKKGNSATCSDVDATGDCHTHEANHRERRAPHDITCICSEAGHEWARVWGRNRPTDVEKTCEPRREGGGPGSLGLADANS